MRAEERKREIWEVMQIRWEDKIENLMQEFGVSRSTMKRDLQEISLIHPLIVQPGHGGGVRVDAEYRSYRTKMSPEQARVLRRAADSAPTADRTVLLGILEQFGPW